MLSSAPEQISSEAREVDLGTGTDDAIDGSVQESAGGVSSVVGIPELKANCVDVILGEELEAAGVTEGELRLVGAGCVLTDDSTVGRAGSHPHLNRLRGGVRGF